MARDAVFRSWMNDRAVYYRKQNRIPDDLGTAVNVQAMVFGNLGDRSATGVGFTRDPATGENRFYGEYLVNAQGEDVVAGVRTPHPIADLEKEMPEAYRQLREITGRLEKHYRDVQDFEFTIEDGKLYLLQTRTGKRTAAASGSPPTWWTRASRRRRHLWCPRIIWTAPPPGGPGETHSGRGSDRRAPRPRGRPRRGLGRRRWPGTGEP
jgi:hypothetical protein